MKLCGKCKHYTKAPGAVDSWERDGSCECPVPASIVDEFKQAVCSEADWGCDCWEEPKDTELDWPIWNGDPQDE